MSACITKKIVGEKTEKKNLVTTKWDGACLSAFEQISNNRYPQVEVAYLWIQFLHVVINRSHNYWNQYIAKGKITIIFLLILILYFKNTQIVLDVGVVGQELMLFVFLQVGQFWCPAPVTSMELAADSSGRELVCGDQLGSVHFFVVQDLH